MEDTTSTSSQIIGTINEIFENLFSSIDSSLYQILDNLTFIDSNILNDKYFENIFGTSASNGILLICNSFLIGFLLYFIIKYFTSNFTLAQIENPGQFVLKIIIFGICMNSSYFIIEQILTINSNISLAIKSIGEDLFNQNISFANLIENINSNLNISNDSLNVFSIDGLIKGTLTMSLLNLVTVYSLRYIMVKIFVLLTPFSILSLSMEKTSWIFKLWFKNLLSLLLIQSIVSIVLLLLFSIDYNDSNLTTKFVYIGGIYALIKANSFIKDFMMGAGM